MLSFHDDTYKRYNGVYTARDTGGAIKGYKIDLFMGDFGLVWKEHQSTKNFGRVKATAVVLNN